MQLEDLMHYYTKHRNKTYAFFVIIIPCNSNIYFEVILMSSFKRIRDYVIYTSTVNITREPFWYYDRGLDDIFLPDGFTSIEDVVQISPVPPTDDNLIAVADQAIVDQAIVA